MSFALCFAMIASSWFKFPLSVLPLMIIRYNLKLIQIKTYLLILGCHVGRKYEDNAKNARY